MLGDAIDPHADYAHLPGMTEFKLNIIRRIQRGYTVPEVGRALGLPDRRVTEVRDQTLWLCREWQDARLRYGLSANGWNILFAAGISSLGQLEKAISNGELRRCHGCGDAIYRELTLWYRHHCEPKNVT